MNKEIQNKALRRLKIIEGQVRGVQSMIEREDYCPDIITQTSAIRKALSGLEDLILENHLTTHVAKQMKSNDEQTAIQEMLRIYTLSKRL